MTLRPLTDNDADFLSSGPGLILVREAEKDAPADERRGAWPVARPLVEPGQGRSHLDAADKAGALDWIALAGVLIMAAVIVVAVLASAAANASYLRKDGTNWPPTADLAMGGRSFTGLRNAAAAAEPVTKAQLDALDVAFDARLDALEAGVVPRGSLLVVVSGANTWTVPANVTALRRIRCVGGGGGGGGGRSPGGSGRPGGGGGAGGECSEWTNIPVTPGAVYAYAVGAGGAGGAVNTNGSAGGATSITIGATTYQANGGAPGQAGAASDAATGPGGVGARSTGIPGGNGGTGGSGASDSPTAEIRSR